VSGLQRLPRGASRRARSRVQLSVEQEREHRLLADGVNGPVALGRFKQERGDVPPRSTAVAVAERQHVADDILQLVHALAIQRHDRRCECVARGEVTGRAVLRIAARGWDNTEL
jgi:hypothetical protein